jgi:hypothetical protein
MTLDKAIEELTLYRKANPDHGSYELVVPRASSGCLFFINSFVFNPMVGNVEGSHFVDEENYEIFTKGRVLKNNSLLLK